LENITPDDFAIIQQALYKNQLIIFKGQQDLSPRAQYELTRCSTRRRKATAMASHWVRRVFCTPI
jgi:hypothetical protein